MKKAHGNVNILKLLFAVGFAPVDFADMSGRFSRSNSLDRAFCGFLAWDLWGLYYTKTAFPEAFATGLLWLYLRHSKH